MARYTNLIIIIIIIIIIFNLDIPHTFNSTAISGETGVGRCGVVGSTLAFGSIYMGSNPSTAYFHIMVHQPSAS